jgi:hypothetical protein
MADDTKSSKHQLPQWLGRDIVSEEHFQDLEQRAAVHEFHSKMPRHEAEAKAHDDYVKEHREKAAAHHLAGMKMAQAVGNLDEAKKHWTLYDLHLKALGKDSIGQIPAEIEHRLKEDQVGKMYRFKAHHGDAYAFHQPKEEHAAAAPTEGLGKAEAKRCKWKLGERRCQRLVGADYCHDHKDHWANKVKQKESLEKAAGTQADPVPLPGPRLPSVAPVVPPVTMAEVQGKAPRPKTPPRAPAEAFAEGKAPVPVLKPTVVNEGSKALPPAGALAETGSPLHDAAAAHANSQPPAGAKHLATPPAAAPAGPKLHDTVEGFAADLKTMPKGSSERGKFITAHANHGPFLAALKAHPQGAAIHASMNQFLNGRGNAGVAAGKTKVTAQ